MKDQSHRLMARVGVLSKAGLMIDVGAYVRQQVLEKVHNTETNAQPVGKPQTILKERMESVHDRSNQQR